MSRRAKNATRGNREWWSQKTRCLKTHGSHEWFRNRPRLENLVASMHMRTTSLPSPLTSISRLIFWLSYRMPRLSASSSLMYSPMYSHRKEPRGMKSGLRTPQPFENLPSVSPQRYTSRRKRGPSCTCRFLQRMSQQHASVHSYTDSTVCGVCRKRPSESYGMSSRLAEPTSSYGHGHGSRIGPPSSSRTPSLTTHCVTYVKSLGAGSLSNSLYAGIASSSCPPETSAHSSPSVRFFARPLCSPAGAPRDGRTLPSTTSTCERSGKSGWTSLWFCVLRIGHRHDAGASAGAASADASAPSLITPRESCSSSSWPQPMPSSSSSIWRRSAHVVCGWICSMPAIASGVGCAWKTSSSTYCCSSCGVDRNVSA
mmetsp:Transcript_28328/g.76639  ORF Transcript_28328/g.76639 Transcript_28328/m.76639 type:complete len:370 (-) Transcript_28328:157-1266(-)